MPQGREIVHLDTSFLIRMLIPGSSEDVLIRRWFADGTTLCVSTIAWAEFLGGPLDQSSLTLAEMLVSERIPFGDEEAKLSARLFNDTGRRRGSFIDCMIAACAITANASIATANTKDFERLSENGLELAR